MQAERPEVGNVLGSSTHARAAARSTLGSFAVGIPMPGDFAAPRLRRIELVTYSRRRRHGHPRPGHAPCRATLPFPAAVAQLSPALGVVAVGAATARCGCSTSAPAACARPNGHDAPVTAWRSAPTGARW